ncbi:MAG: T9SS type A sorting domain-containing protein, partial [Bacteroidota bacterium]
ISYQLPLNGYVTLKVYDMIGKEIATLVNGMQEAGEHTTSFNASHLPSGLYFYSLQTKNFNATKKMLLVK